LLEHSTPVDGDSDIDAPHPLDGPSPLAGSLPHSTSRHSKPRKPIDPLDDAINSDLDDSDITSDIDSEFGENEDGTADAGAGEGPDKSIMLCMYEKVHRTKNKWKCQLREGVISTGGRDWVFSKATGEFEW
jgi:transcription initiation factor TFIIA large subunit